MTRITLAALLLICFFTQAHANTVLHCVNSNPSIPEEEAPTATNFPIADDLSWFGNHGNKLVSNANGIMLLFKSEPRKPTYTIDTYALKLPDLTVRYTMSKKEGNVSHSIGSEKQYACTIVNNYLYPLELQSGD